MTTTLVISPVTGRMTSAISVSSGLMDSIIYSTPMMVVTLVMSCVSDWFMPEDMVSTSFVMRESTSPTERFSKYFIGIRPIFSVISRRRR